MAPLNGFISYQSFLESTATQIIEEVTEDIPGTMPYYNKLYQLPQFAGIGVDKVDYLIEEQLITKEDFEKVTEKEVLAIQALVKSLLKN